MVGGACWLLLPGTCRLSLVDVDPLPLLNTEGCGEKLYCVSLVDATWTVAQSDCQEFVRANKC